jgi:hypothetical protein
VSIVHNFAVEQTAGSHSLAGGGSPRRGWISVTPWASRTIGLSEIRDRRPLSAEPLGGR